MITATPEPDAARVRLALTGGTPGESVYVFRRDTAGVGLVRDTSAGTITWPALGPVVLTNRIENGELDDENGDGYTDGLTVGPEAVAVRVTENTIAGAAVRLTWPPAGTVVYPSSGAYPGAATYPTGA